VKVLDPAGGRETLTLDQLDDFYCVAFSPDGLKVATGEYETVRIRNAASGQK
jgi:hypothetical protein